MENSKPHLPKWPSYLAIKVSANNHNEEILAQHIKILAAREMPSKMNDSLREATLAKHKIDRQVQHIDNRITILQSKIVTPHVVYEMPLLQASLKLCKEWQSKILKEIAICQQIAANCKKFIDAADRTEIDQLMQKHFMTEGDEEKVDDFEQHGEDWIREGNRALEVLKRVPKEIMEE